MGNRRENHRGHVSCVVGTRGPVNDVGLIRLGFQNTSSGREPRTKHACGNRTTHLLTGKPWEETNAHRVSLVETHSSDHLAHDQPGCPGGDREHLQDVCRGGCGRTNQGSHDDGMTVLHRFTLQDDGERSAQQRHRLSTDVVWRPRGATCATFMGAPGLRPYQLL